MYKAAITLPTFLTTPLRARLLVACLVGVMSVSSYLTARAEFRPNELAPTDIQEKVRAGDKIIIGTKDWFVIGNEKYKVFTLQVTQVTSAAIVGKRVEAGSRDPGDEGEVTVPFEQIDTIDSPYEGSTGGHYLANHFKCYFGLFPAIVLHPIPTPMREPAACSGLTRPAPRPSGLP